MRHKPAIDGAKKIARFPHHSCRENTVINASGNAAGNNHMKNPTCCLYLGRSMDRRGYYQPTHTWFKSQPIPAELAKIWSMAALTLPNQTGTLVSVGNSLTLFQLPLLQYLEIRP